VALVVEVTVTGPNVPGAEPPTDTPSPKLIFVEPWTKFVSEPVTCTFNVCPGDPTEGVIAERLAPGLIVREAALELAKVVPVVV
jgi:hypothetical protein